MKLRDIGKRYGRQTWVLTHVQVDLPPGELIAFSGGNGSGKSTLLRIVVGVTRPTTGRVTDRPALIGYVPDRFPPDERMSALDYLTHMGRVSGLRGEAAGRRAESLLERLALVGGADTALRALSKGNAQKVALAQALMVPPQLLVLDEPWSGLDSSAHGVLAEIMNEITRAGGTLVFTDHRESVVRANATRIYRVAGGSVTLDENPTRMTRPTETRLVLRAPVNEYGIPRTADWRSCAGVVTAHDNGAHTTIHVTSAYADELILAALREGWSMVEAGMVHTSQVSVHGGAS
ncbi:ATP-binding protein [Streptomyces dioscori]|uniref:ATP-binding protein n=1 Tax=Streptomyces dioscori TaxID=2109333 RepID=A0A2P8PVH3_9ACTN|nr:ABC transporter ATP-binding protein [Streptomyces dioscori]PSM38014.1 ATP-binding protein [Streptomyces dioscori]